MPCGTQDAGREGLARFKDPISLVAYLVSEEVAARDATRKDMRLRTARFPGHKTLDNFDFAFQPSVDKKQIRELASLSFLNQATNLLFLGPPGVGKMVCCYPKFRIPGTKPQRSDGLGGRIRHYVPGEGDHVLTGFMTSGSIERRP